MFALLGCQGITHAALVRGPYLQSGTPNSVIVRWYSSASEVGIVMYGTTQGSLNLSQSDGGTTDHAIALTGLSPDTTYYYSVGTPTTTYESGSGNFFVTAPTVGTAKNTRIWVLGDSGTANANQDAVRNAYYSYTSTPARHTDLWLMLGDNAYPNGTLAEHDAAVFTRYQVMLRKSVLWSTLGNHETYNGQNPLPYFNLFTFPMSGQAGGNASGTEKYYSFDYANIHFVCLDSMTSLRTATGPMAVWLTTDLDSYRLSGNIWTIAFWHHPPYTKGSHDSDNALGNDPELVEMRANIIKILEDRGVDLILSGHSHSYERSKLINGHYGLSSSYSDAAHAKDAGTGNGATPYQKPTLDDAPNEGTVYVVAGSSGQTSGGPLNHPAMKVSLNSLGSLVLDVNNGGAVNQLVGTFVRSDYPANQPASLPDTFTIQKKVQTVTVTTPINAAEPSTQGRFSLIRAGGNRLQPLTVSFTLSGTALAGTSGSADYTVQSGGATGVTFDYATLTGTAIIPVNSSGKLVNIVPRDDTTWEGNETIIVTVNGTSSYNVGSPSTTTLNVTDNDLVSVTVTANDPLAAEGGSDNGQFTITRTGSADVPITVNYSVAGTATSTGPGQDYATLPGSVSIPSGGASASATVTVTPLNDTATEVSETVILTAASGTGYTVGSPASGTVTIVGNDGPDPTFGAPWNNPAGNSVRQIIVADVNLDGNPDIVTANYNDDTISVLRAKALGDDFSGPYNTTVGNGPISLVAGHWNTDGKPDLAVANQLDGTVSVLSGNLDATFSLAATYAAGTAPQFIASGDFNTDGKPDLVVGNQGSSFNILLNTTAGAGVPSFGTATPFTLPSGTPRSIGVADLNADGKPDLAIPNGSSALIILLNNGSGGFAPPISYATGSKPYGVAFGYFNQDAVLDLAVANLDQQTVTILQGNGDGTFIILASYAVGGAKAIVAGDFNGDSLPDLIATDENISSLWMLVGNGDGSFEPAFSFPVGMASQTIAAAQFGSDGRLDVAFGYSGSSSVRVMLNSTAPNP